jgi:lactoylglutathione lyase
MTENEVPAPQSGFAVTHVLVVSDQDRSGEFYRSVFGAKVVLGRDPVIMKIANSWLIHNVGGGPTDDKPTVTLAPPADPEHASAFLNLRVADIGAAYAQWSAKGAEPGVLGLAWNSVIAVPTRQTVTDGPVRRSRHRRRRVRQVNGYFRGTDSTVVVMRSAAGSGFRPRACRECQGTRPRLFVRLRHEDGGRRTTRRVRGSGLRVRGFQPRRVAAASSLLPS